MKNAMNSKPDRCYCGRKLGEVQYAELKWKNGVLTPLNVNKHFKVDARHHVSCPCGNVYVWAWPNVWKRMHVLELGCTGEVVG